ncbi:hypothetical protein AHAS_Ahas19G0002100 [Arachis hypogaea]
MGQSGPSNGRRGLNYILTKEKLVADMNHWYAVVNRSYLNGLGINWSSIRNVMDMKTIYGGYACETTRGDKNNDESAFGTKPEDAVQLSATSNGRVADQV